MGARVFLLILFSISLKANAKVTLGIDGGFNYSRLEYKGAASFTLLSSGGTFARSELSLGSGPWEFLLQGELNQFLFEVPGARTLANPEVQIISYGTGFRWTSQVAWLSLTYENKDAPYLIDQSGTAFTLDKEDVGFGVLGLKLFGWGKGYRITLDVNFGVPVSNPTTPLEGDFKYGGFSRGTVRVEFGNNVRAGLMGGIENHDYSVSDSEYHRSDFVAGITLAFGAGKRSSGSGRSLGAY